MVIDDGGAVEVGIVVGGEGVGLLVWVWVYCHGSGFGFATVGCGDCGLLLFFLFSCFGVDGRLWVASGGGVRCVWYNNGGLMVMMVLVNLWLFLNRKNEKERINNVLYCK